MKKFSTSWIVFGIILLLVLWVGATYNGLVSANEGVSGAWADVQAQYQRRFDLLENVKDTAVAAGVLEKSILTDVTNARTQWLSNKGGTIDEQMASTSAYSSALSRLLVSVEAYPQLKSIEGYNTIIVELEGTENRVAVAREDFNAVVRSYNVKVKRFPGAIVANLFGFDPSEFFESEEGADKGVKLDYSN